MQRKPASARSSRSNRARSSRSSAGSSEAKSSRRCATAPKDSASGARSTSTLTWRSAQLSFVSPAMQSRTMRFLVIQHAACEPPGAYEDEMLARRIEFERVELDETRALPDWREFAAIVAMGGPMGANDDDELPWLA